MQDRTKLTKTPDSAEIVGTLDDLLVQILLCLPVNSLVCYQLVSKHWQSLINNSEFRDKFISKQTRAVVGLLGLFRGRYDVWHVDYIPLSSISTTINRVDLIVTHSCNGLLLGRDRRGTFFVCNPTTRQDTAIPQPEHVPGYGGKILSALCFEPTKSPGYKIVSLCSYDLRRLMCHIRIYSSETRLWRRISVAGARFTEDFKHVPNPVYWNGAVHWIGLQYSLYFDIEDEVCKTFPSPPNASELSTLEKYYFGESGDHLHFVDISTPSSKLNVYELERDRFKWFIKYKVDLSVGLAAVIGDCYPSKVLCVVRSGEDERDSFLVLKIEGIGTVRYNIVSNTYQELRKFGRDGLLQVFQYIESLLPV